jgi:alpha-tubulin suppressor-like RCC1 family protein
MMRHGLAGLAIALSACSLNVEGGDGGGFACEPDGSCAAGLMCVQDVCVPEPPACAAKVAAGDGHSCALRTDGTVWCWGRNDHGQLGNDTVDDADSPVQVVAGTVNGVAVKLPKFSAVSAGSTHSCALGEDGTAWCWGASGAGQVGNSRGSEFHTPQQVAGLTGVLAITAAAAHSCAIRGDRVAVCWGGNDEGQLGNGGFTPSAAPVEVQTLQGVTAIAAGSASTCAVDGSHKVWCWGANDHGQLGDPVRDSRGTPRMVALPFDAAAGVAVGGGFSCALSTRESGGKVACFGVNSAGQLGAIVFEDESPTPVAVTFGGVAVSIVAGANFACLVDDAGAPWCWGNNDNFVLTDPTGQARPVPVRASYGAVSAVAAGSHACAVLAGGGLRCVGYNGRGQLGNGQRTTQSVPGMIDGITDATGVASGAAHSCATRMNGTVVCWGANTWGALGDGTWDSRAAPEPVASLAGATSVVAGFSHTCALVGGMVACWGRNNRGQLGDATKSGYTRGNPVIVPNLTGVTQLAAGGNTTCALVEGGTVYCWGQGDFGQLAIGNKEADFHDSDAPLAVQMLGTGVREIAVGDFHVCAVNNNYTVSCWGRGENGQLGNAANSGAGLPVPVAMLTGADHIAAGYAFSCAHTMADQVFCWGYGYDGQLGNSGFGQVNMPVRVDGSGGVTQLVAGGAHACMVKGSGLSCWGAGYAGEVGDSVYDRHASPAAVSGGPMVRAVAAGEQHTCAALMTGGVACWGDGQSGQLGDGVLATTRPVAPALPCP